MGEFKIKNNNNYSYIRISNELTKIIRESVPDMKNFVGRIMSISCSPGENGKTEYEYRVNHDNPAGDRTEGNIYHPVFSIHYSVEADYNKRTAFVPKEAVINLGHGFSDDAESLIRDKLEEFIRKEYHPDDSREL